MLRKLDDLRKVPVDQGKAQEFAAPYERVVEATQQAIVDAGLTIKETDSLSESQTVILAERGITAMSWGELVRVIVDGSRAGVTTVRVTTMRRFALNLTAKGDFSKAIFDGISRILDPSSNSRQ